MNYIVLDFEFNQYFKFDENDTSQPIKECRFEIIQIGALKYDENLCVINSFNRLIKPQIYERINPIVQNMTGLDYDALKNENTFCEVIKDFFEFTGNDYVYCVWNLTDLKALYKNLKYYNLVSEPFIAKYIDVQLIATKHLNTKKGGLIGLENAVNLLNIEKNDKFHNAFNDAYYTGEVFKKIKTESTNIKVFNSARIKKVK